MTLKNTAMMWNFPIFSVKNNKYTMNGNKSNSFGFIGALKNKSDKMQEIKVEPLKLEDYYKGSNI